MKLEKMCVSLKLSKKLQELGVKKNSWCKWETDSESKKYRIWPFAELYENECAAFTASELLEMLPEYVKFDGEKEESYLYLDKWKINNATKYRVMYVNTGDNSQEIYNPITYYIEENLANACAQMLIYLIENGYVKAEDL